MTKKRQQKSARNPSNNCAKPGKMIPRDPQDDTKSRQDKIRQDLDQDRDRDQDKTS